MSPAAAWKGDCGDDFCAAPPYAPEGASELDMSMDRDFRSTAYWQELDQL